MPSESDNLPAQNPQLTCEHHYVSYHQGDFPKAVYWVRICTVCKHIIPELTAGFVVADPDDPHTIERVMDALADSQPWRAGRDAVTARAMLASLAVKS